MSTRWLLGAAAIAFLLAPARARATLVDPAFAETVWVTSPDLGLATSMAWAPDGSNRLFVTRKEGEVRIVRDGVVLPAPFVSLTPVFTNSECGLLGIVFDPDFLTNHYVYLFATVSAFEQQIIRYTAEGDTGTDPTVIVAGLPTLGVNHDGGALGIGPDGMLYWGVGDNGNGSGSNDDTVSHAAKIGRAHLDGSPATDNPLFDGPGPNADYTWARGFRNPFTLTFQPATGLLWLDDVGGGYEQVFVVHRGDHAGWFQYENNQPDGFITPSIKYRTNGVDSLPILPLAMSGAVRAGGVVTFTTAAEHHFRAGEQIAVSGVTDVSFDGSFFVATTAPTSFTVAQAGPDAASGDGTATTAAIGGCVTGAAFYDATQFPATYRGNYFFADFNSGNMVRATLDTATNGVKSVELWGNEGAGAVDMAVGPDGALYYVGVSNSTVYRASYQVQRQALVVWPTDVWMAEGTPAIVMVQLAMPPAETIVVSAARVDGDTDVAVSSGSSLTFTPSDWNVPQLVNVAAGRDLDTADDLSTIAISASDLTPEMITVHVRDVNAGALVVSTPTLGLDEGSDATVTVALTERPSLDVVVGMTLTGDTDIAVPGDPIVFNSGDWATPRTVTVSAAIDADGIDDMATIVLAAAGLPSATVMVTARDTVQAPTNPADAGIDAPKEGAAVSIADAGAEARSERPDVANAADGAPAAAPPADFQPRLDSDCSCRIGRGGRGGRSAPSAPVIAVVLAALWRKRRGRAHLARSSPMRDPAVFPKRRCRGWYSPR